MVQIDTNWITSLSLFNYTLEIYIDEAGHLIAVDAFVTSLDTFYVKETNNKKRIK